MCCVLLGITEIGLFGGKKMPYRMKNRFLILGLTGPLGAGCSDTAKFLSGKEVNNLTIKETLNNLIESKKRLKTKIPQTYEELEKIKKSIDKRKDKRLGPYKKNFIDPNTDDKIRKLEKESKIKYHKLKIYLRQREVIEVLEKFVNDSTLEYDNLNLDDRNLFGFSPFINISMTSIILKIAIETYYTNDGKRQFADYFGRKTLNIDFSDGQTIINKIKHQFVSFLDSIEERKDVYISSSTFINVRGYKLPIRLYPGSLDKEVSDKYNELICTTTVAFYEYLSKIYKFRYDLKKFIDDQIDDSYAFVLSEILQDWGDNCRATGNPFIDITEGDNFDPEHLYSLSVEINSLIKFLRYRTNSLNENFFPLDFNHNDNKTPTLFIVECFRNPYEIEFFRSRYAEFYLFSINAPKDIRKERVKYFSIKRDERDQGADRRAHELNKLDVRSCVLMSDITISNDRSGGMSQKDFFEKFLRYFALIRSPGCIPPNDDELYMHLAYSNSLKSNCISRKVGAVILGPKGFILGSGWNDVGEGQVGCGLRRKEDYLSIDDIPKVTSELDLDEFHRLLTKSPGDYVCYKDIMSKLQINKKLNKIADHKNCTKECINKIKGELGIKRLEYCRALHAEENAILQLAKIGGMPISGGTIYTTTYPCELCAKKLYQTGIRTIYYNEPYPESISEEVFLKDGNRSIEMVPFQGIKSHSFFKLFKPVYDKKELSYIESFKKEIICESV
jgi:deoxycytidylate deaminase